MAAASFLFLFRRLSRSLFSFYSSRLNYFDSLSKHSCRPQQEVVSSERAPKKKKSRKTQSTCSAPGVSQLQARDVSEPRTTERVLVAGGDERRDPRRAFVTVVFVAAAGDGSATVCFSLRPLHKVLICQRCVYICSTRGARK